MVIRFLRWFGSNMSTLLTAFVLAMVVWIAATISNDPNRENWLRNSVRLEVAGKDPNLIVMNDFADQVRVRLTAPDSIWTQLNSDLAAVTAQIDLSGFGAGTHPVDVQVRVNNNISPVRILNVDPQTVEVVLEPLVVQPVSVTLTIEGEPGLGYQADTPTFEPEVVTVSGPQSLVSQVENVRAYLSISGSRQNIQNNITVQPLDRSGNIVRGVDLDPETIAVTQPVTLQGGYRNVIVKVNVVGDVANGYRLTNITVSPPGVTVFSSDPIQVNELPGYIEAEPLDLTGVTDDIETYLNLLLPEGISVVNDQKVLVQVSVAAIESNMNFALPVEIVGLNPRLVAELAPATVEIILSGPVPVLDNLRPDMLRAVVDLSGLEPGVHQVSPAISFLPSQVRIESILPPSLEITIKLAPTPTPTLTPMPTPTPTPTGTPPPG